MRELAALDLPERHMAGDRVVFHALDHIDEPVGLGIDKHIVNLVVRGITEEDKLCMHARACQHQLCKVRRDFVRFIDDHNSVGNRLPAQYMSMF